MAALTAAAAAAADAQGQWFTPPPLAAAAAAELRAIARCGPLAMPARPRILEPCAGDGALIAATLRAFPGARIDAVECDPHLAAGLRLRFGRRVRVIAADFLERERPALPYDAAILNPPQHRSRPGWDGEFLGATIAQSRRLVAVLRLNAITGADRYQRAWKRCAWDWTLTGVRPLVSRPSFLLRGTAPGPGKGPRHDWAIVSMARGRFDAPRPVFDWLTLNHGDSEERP